jgi:hypothetical protein
MAITKDRGRQTVLTAMQHFTYDDFTSGVATEAVDLPGGAYIISGELVITTAFNSGTSDAMEVGDSGGVATLLSSTSVASTGRTDLTPPDAPLSAKDAVTIELTSVGAAATAGAGFLRVEYVIDGRANEVQP